MSAVTVIVPTWNRQDLLARLLNGLGRQSHKVDGVVVVDNGSEDGSAETAAAWGARVIRMGWNSGFCRAVNRGISEVKTPWVAVVNNDVEPTPDWLARLMAAAQDPRVWFAAGKLLNSARRDSIDGAFDLLCRGGCAWRAGHGRRDGPEWGETRTIRFAPFTAALFRRELFGQVGLLDESFDSYLEDVDFGLRCAMQGFEGVYVPGAVAYHAGSGTLGEWHGRTARQIARNQVFVVAKHFPAGSLVRNAWAICVSQGLWGLLALRHGAGWAYLRGKIDGIRQFGSIRRSAGGEFGRLPAILKDSESEILELQRRTGFDLYWRLYFALT